MNTFIVLTTFSAQFQIDTNLYSKSVITKVVYWLNQDFVVSTSCKSSNVVVCLESKVPVDWENQKKHISCMLSDFQMREVIEKETHDIRNILYIKAFSNVDDFVEYDIESENI